MFETIGVKKVFAMLECESKGDTQGGTQHLQERKEVTRTNKQLTVKTKSSEE